MLVTMLYLSFDFLFSSYRAIGFIPVTHWTGRFIWTKTKNFIWIVVWIKRSKTILQKAIENDRKKKDVEAGIIQLKICTTAKHLIYIPKSWSHFELDKKECLWSFHCTRFFVCLSPHEMYDQTIYTHTSCHDLWYIPENVYNHEIQGVCCWVWYLNYYHMNDRIFHTICKYLTNIFWLLPLLEIVCFIVAATRHRSGSTQ